MLALSRKVNESIMIGHDIEITILEIKGDQIKIGISAPKSVPIYRKELYLQILESNKEAASSEISQDTLKNLFDWGAYINKYKAGIKILTYYDDIVINI